MSRKGPEMKSAVPVLSLPPSAGTGSVGRAGPRAVPFRQRSRLLCLLSAVLLLGGCAVGSGAPRTTEAPTTTTTTSPPASTPDGAVYETRSFRVPLRLVVPDWLPTVADQDKPNFVTWDRPEQPAVRILVPAVVYPAGKAKAVRPADDFVGYLLGMRAAGATFTEQSSTTLDGHPTTVVTATASRALDGSLGCPEVGQVAADCFGLQPDLRLRIAVVSLPGTVLLVWLRLASTSKRVEAAGKIASFEHMLTTIRLLGGTPSPATSSAAPDAATPIDGSWSAHWSRRDLAKSPLLYGPEEVNDGNWGTYTLTFQRGQAVETIRNPKHRATNRFTYTVNGDVATFVRGNESFVMRWRISGRNLTFVRDDALGGGPTPYVIRPFARRG